MDFGIAGVAAITVICYLVAEGVKKTAIDNKWLPTISGTVGAVFGVLGYMIMPDFPANDFITALAVGIVSGLAATGAHQAYKQLSEGGGNDA